MAGALGLQISHSLREVYFKCPPSRRAGQEVEFTLPGMPQRFAATIPEGVEPGYASQPVSPACGAPPPPLARRSGISDRTRLGCWQG